MKWLITEYRHEDSVGRYYIEKVMTIWWGGFRTGLVLGFIPLVAYWIMR